MATSITSLVRRDETIKRYNGNGDNFHMSWAADDRQYVAVCDGMGFSEQPRAFYNSRLWTIEGGPQDARFAEVAAYPELTFPSANGPLPGYYGFGTLALDGSIYQYLTTTGTGEDNQFAIGAKLIFSPDDGRTWCNQDGSSPVVWEPAEQRSRDNMVFFRESQNAFSLMSILQMGRNYEHNRDGYVYAYAPNGGTDGTGNELVMFRVPKADILKRSSYEFFAGHKAGGEAAWAPDIDARDVVITFPRGHVCAAHAHTWVPSVVYNAGLGLYLMANFGRSWCAPDDTFTISPPDPSYLGFWVAERPWGPWTQVHEETAWLPDGDPNAVAYEAQIAPKWIAPDGRSFWLVWTDLQTVDVPDEQSLVSADGVQMGLLQQRRNPYYTFNVQRVDVSV